GPNGAGKTTFVNLVATLLRLDGGTLRVGGHDVARHPAAVRRLVALAGQYAAVEPTLTGRENVEMVARLFGHSRAQARSDAAADHLAAQIAIIDHGQVVASGTPRELKRSVGRRVVEVHVRDTAALDRVAAILLAIGEGAPTVDVPTRSVRVALGAETRRVFAALRPLDDTDIAIDEVSVRQPTLDEAFLALTGTPKENVA